MDARRVDTWVWVLIYVGLIMLGLGLSARRDDATLGWCIAAAGSALAGVGIALIWVRSRMKGPA